MVLVALATVVTGGSGRSREQVQTLHVGTEGAGSEGGQHEAPPSNGADESVDLQRPLFVLTSAGAVGRLDIATGALQTIEAEGSARRVVGLGATRVDADAPTRALADPANGCAFSIDHQGSGGASSATGTNPAVSPDGTRLAYVHVHSGGEAQGCARQDLVVRDLESGHENSWTAAWDGGGFSTGHIISKLQWSPDSRLLVFGTYDAKLFVLDPEVEGMASIRDARLVRGQQAGLQYPIWSESSGTLIVKDVAGGPDLRSPVIEVDPGSGRVVRTLLDDVGHGVLLRFDDESGELLVLKPLDSIPGDDSTRSQVVSMNVNTQSFRVLLEGDYIDAA